MEVDAQDAKDGLVAEAPGGEIVRPADGSPETEPGEQLPGAVEQQAGVDALAAAGLAQAEVSGPAAGLVRQPTGKPVLVGMLQVSADAQPGRIALRERARTVFGDQHVGVDLEDVVVLQQVVDGEGLLPPDVTLRERLGEDHQVGVPAARGGFEGCPAGRVQRSAANVQRGYAPFHGIGTISRKA